MPEAMIDREMNADATAARQETARANFRRLIEEDPYPHGPHATREWLSQVSGWLDLYAEVADQPELQAEIRRDVSNFKMQADALVGGREADQAAWQQLVGYAKDVMNAVLAGPERSQEAA
ncbi:MAG: hypothetical protein HY976_02485 [Candidatus Kerfeldbacteria bacterium]|nr:hypothetical protein [Candidatus Kerfeldbacteria bacterium]